jgi:hypothetical protein
MASTEQTTIGGILLTLVPKDGVILVGWGLMAEWEEPNGEHPAHTAGLRGEQPLAGQGVLL